MPAEPLRILVAMGGPSAEHDVSIDSGRRVLEGLREAGHTARPLRIDRQGGWHLDDRRFEVGAALERLCSDPPDVVFLALHGEFGEDGTVQGLLEVAGLPYTGSGVLGSALAMDKVRSRWIFQQHGIEVPRGAEFSGARWRQARDGTIGELEATLPPPPWFVKPTDRGSSVGSSVVRGTGDLYDAAEEALRFSEWVLVEEYVEGDEVTCGVVDRFGDGSPEAFPVTEIVPRQDDFFDYHAKYTPGATAEITPARLPEPVLRRIQQVSLRVHSLLHLRGMSRTDAIVRRGAPCVLEVNTIPGLTQTSLLPQGAAAAGISFPELVDRVARLASEPIASSHRE